MLEFFRKHQKYFFAVISVVIITSFSFFGTYDTLAGNAIHDQVAFKAVDGTNIKRGELDSMVHFIGTDNDDKRFFGGAWGPNFLNDGVIKKDFLNTGLAEILVAAYPEPILRDLEPRLEKEKRFTLYTHPQAKFLSTEEAWAYFIPNMKSYFDVMRGSKNPVSNNAFTARVGLFLSERRFPPQMLKQILRYQEKQYSWLAPDQNLDYIDLSLFGYHTTEDWFGPRFMRLIAEFIINGSKLAQEKGYQVSKTEALADLMRNSEASYQQNLKNPNLGVTNSSEYFNEQLRLLGMDQTQAVKIWQQVLLFRRLFQDVGNSVLVDNLMPQKFYAFAKETVSGDLYSLPVELQLADYRSLQKFETYLYATAKRGRVDKMSDKELLAVPTSFLSLEEVKKKYPELIQKQYDLRVAHASKSALYPKVGLKDTWNWEVEDANWARLKKEFPTLGVKKGDTRDERFAALDSLDDRTRGRVDAIARSAIVDSHPEWLQKALEAAPEKQMLVGISTRGGDFFVKGLENRDELIRLLDNAPLINQTKEQSSATKQAASALAQFSGDNINYYRITVVERKPEEKILTYAQADEAGVLDQLLDKQLEAQYAKIREVNPAQYRQEDGSWKALDEVKDRVADSYFEKLIKAIQADYIATSGDKTVATTTMTGDRAASLRFYAHARDLRTKLQQGAPDAAEQIIEVQPLSKEDEPLVKAIDEQLKLEKVPYKADRSTLNDSLDIGELIALAPNAWSAVRAPVNGELSFMQVKSKGNGDGSAAIVQKTSDMHRLLSNDAQRNYMHGVVRILKDKNAISLDYMESSEEEMGPEELKTE
jgi:GcvH upstream region-like protein